MISRKSNLVLAYLLLTIETGHTEVWHHTVSWTITFFFRLLHETPMKNRAKSAESKGKKVTDKKRVFSVVGKEDKKKPKSVSKEELALQLKTDVKNINDNIMKEGERLFFTRIPEKVIELTEYMNVSSAGRAEPRCLTFFRISPCSRSPSRR